MPVITLKLDRFNKLLGRSLSLEELTRWIPWIGVDIEEVGSDYVKIEYNPNRIDFSSQVGVARAFKGILEWETGLITYSVEKGNVELNVNETVSKVRPYIVGAVIRNLSLDEESVKELMEMQEDLHWGIGRDRKKASIGVHNLDVVEPPFTYTTVHPDEVKFVPLDKEEEMSLKEILEKHEKGIAYRHLVDWAPRYPLLIDKHKRVLSFPPIINGELTKVDEKTRNLFIDVTGTDFNSVVNSLNVLVTALADLGGKVEAISVNYPDRKIITPNLSPQKMKLSLKYANKVLGLKLNEEEVIKCLRKCRLDAFSLGNGTIEVHIPAYRIDILHEIDLVEEVAIGYGYYNLEPTLPATTLVGEQHSISKLANKVRQIMIGLGFTEVMNFILTNETVQYVKMRWKTPKTIRLANPVSTEYSIVREQLLPCLMKNLSDNKHESYPQRLFEVSDVIKVNLKAETMSERRLHLAAVSAHANANYTEIRSVVDALLLNLGLKKWEVYETKNPSFIAGRVASINHNGRKIGILGEIHPEVLENFELENPVAAFEIDLESFVIA